MELSVEFFPPKTVEGAAKLRAVREQLAATLKPTFFSVINTRWNFVYR
jgi:methylenetetrahydrofolate reductase (NADPH)